MEAEVVVYRCPVECCGYSCRDKQQFIGHMAGTMQNDPAHRWENVSIDHHNVEPAAEKVVHASLDQWNGA